MEKLTPICVCVPCQDQVQTGFAFDLAALCGNWASNHRDKPLHLIALKGSILPGQRTKIAKQALEAGASHLFWLDTDMRFPPDALDRLMARDVEFVAANYVTRRGEIRPTAVSVDDKPMFTNPDSSGLEDAMIVGFGVALMERNVIERLTHPYFCTSYDTEKNIFIGEDAYFCFKCKEAGIIPKIDHDLSKRICHTGVIDYHHKHANKGQEGF